MHRKSRRLPSLRGTILAHGRGRNHASVPDRTHHQPGGNGDPAVIRQTRHTSSGENRTDRDRQHDEEQWINLCEANFVRGVGAFPSQVLTWAKPKKKRGQDTFLHQGIRIHALHLPFRSHKKPPGGPFVIPPAALRGSSLISTLCNGYTALQAAFVISLP